MEAEDVEVEHGEGEAWEEGGLAEVGDGVREEVAHHGLGARPKGPLGLEGEGGGLRREDVRFRSRDLKEAPPPF